MTLEVRELDSIRSVEELANYRNDVVSRIRALDEEYQGLPFPEAERAEYAGWQKMLTEELEPRIAELTARADFVGRLGERDRNVDAPAVPAGPRPSVRELDIYDMSTIRGSFFGGGEQELVDRARRAVEIGRSPHVDDQVRARDELIDFIENADIPSAVARRILATGSPAYRAAYFKSIAAQLTSSFPVLSGEEQRAMQQAQSVRALSLTGSAGGFAVPYTLDPTLIRTSNYAINPFRAISRVERITGDEWRGVTSGAITASYAAEATETTDNSPTLANPTISTEKAQAFIPFSIEIGQDWGGLQAEMGGLLAEAKDELEATKFVSGSGTTEPAGVITGATNTVNATTGQTFDAEDLYRLEGTLPARYRPRASIVANRSIYNLVRQFDTQGGAQMWVRVGQGLRASVGEDGRLGEALLGYPTYEASAMAGTAATGNKFLIIGDFSRYVIVDRVGLDVEVIPHLFGTNHRPTGQRGLYAFWRNSAAVVDANAFRVLIGIA